MEGGKIMKELQLFNHPNFGNVRVVDVDGKPYFVAADVARCLGYKDTTNATKQHCRGVVKRHIIDTLGRKQQVNIIPKGDIYRLAAKSELPGAEKFESWIFDDVLVSVGEHGAYLTPDKIEEVLLNPDTIIQLATQLKSEREQNQMLSVELERKDQLIGELKPKADYVDFILSSAGTVTTTQIAADYCMSAQELNKILYEEKIQRKVDGQWILYKDHMGLGYTKSETIDIMRSNGRPDVKMHTKWTQKGRLLVNGVLNRRGMYANMDLITL